MTGPMTPVPRNMLTTTHWWSTRGRDGGSIVSLVTISREGTRHYCGMYRMVHGAEVFVNVRSNLAQLAESKQEVLGDWEDVFGN